jgi:alpha-1,2-mannosyltransferase
VCLLKPQLGLFAIWALIRKDWRFLGGLAATGAIGLGLSVLLFGIQNHIAYLDVLSYMSRHGEGHLSNHSFNGLLHRVTGNDDGLVWSNEAFSPYNPIVHVGTLITSLALVVIGLWPRGSTAGMNGLYQFQLAALAFTIASPMAWEPHYGVLAPMFAVLLCAVMTMPAGKARRHWLMALAATFVFAAMHLPVVGLFAHTPLMVLQSYLLFAALGVLFMLWRLSGRSAAAA